MEGFAGDGPRGDYASYEQATRDRADGGVAQDDRAAAQGYAAPTPEPGGMPTDALHDAGQAGHANRADDAAPGTPPGPDAGGILTDALRDAGQAGYVDRTDAVRDTGYDAGDTVSDTRRDAGQTGTRRDDALRDAGYDPGATRVRPATPGRLRTRRTTFPVRAPARLATTATW